MPTGGRKSASRPAEKAKGPKKRMSYDAEFKIMVVKAALQRPPQNRIKPTCAHFPGIEPCQVRDLAMSLHMPPSNLSPCTSPCSHPSPDRLATIAAAGRGDHSSPHS